ncbi:regulator of G-protein signaling 12-like isoform X2 [Amphiura filiformis]|uniref:regulator of G-protein signaling 12-like isoform X2 n=1 Tax=Amphiura filiformis TaxID=82378 RepID=UPI003B2180B7
MTGQYPCALGTIMPDSPAEVAGLSPDVCVMAVNGENVTRMSHEQIIKLIGSTSGVLRLTVADAVPMSDSSDEDYVQQRKYRTRHQQYRSKSATPSAQSRAEMVVAEIQRAALVNPYGHHPMYSAMPQHATAALDNSKFAPGHLSPFNQTGQPDHMYRQSPQMYAEEALQYANLPKMQKPRKSRHGEMRSHSAQPHHNSFYERYDPMDDLDEDRALSPIELSNIMYPSMQPRATTRSRSPQRPPPMPVSQPAMMRCVVGYLGSIDIPASANLPTASLQAIRGCVRRLRMEQRVHSLMLMEITSIGVTLINSNRKVTVLYPADRVAFSGVCPDDKRVFGIVTAQNPEDAIDSIDSDDEPIGSSCHVFFVDPELSHHSIHAQYAMQFGVQCATNPDTGLCEEFPPSSKPILHNVSQLYRDRQNHLMQYADVYGQSPYAGLGMPNRSNSNSSNSDSGFGNGNHDSNGNSGGPDHVILNVAAHIRNQRARGNIPGASPINPRLSNQFSMSQSSDPYSMSSNATSPSSAEKSPQSGISPGGDVTGRLTPRARPDPVGFQSPSVVKQTSRQRPQSVNTIQQHQHQTKATPHRSNHNTATLDRYPNRRPDNMMFNTAYGGPVIQPKIKSKPHVPPRMDAGVKGLPPSGRLSLYTGSTDMMHGTRHDEEDGGHVRWRQDVRRNSDCSEYSWSHGPKGAGGKKSSRKVQLNEPGNRESLAASDGDLDTQDDGLIGTTRGNALDITGKIPQQNNIGRVSSWAVGFERLLQDQLGLECFTQFLKKEFSEENIMFWIACEQMGKMKDKATLEKHAQDIFEKFLAPNASMPVNLEGQCREMVEEAIKNPTPEMFKTQQQQIFKLMKFDSYSRFLKSKMYQDCVIAEMAGEPLPFLKPAQTPANDPAKLAATEERANKKKRSIKKNRSPRPSESGSNNSYPSDTLERKRRPVLPWNKVLPGKIKKSSADLSQDDDSISRTSNTSDAAENSGMELGTHGKYQAYSTAVRFLFPNNDTVTLPARSGCSVRDAILPLCEARQLPVQALEIFQAESKEPKQSKRPIWKRKISSSANSSASDDNIKNLVDLEQELSTLAGAEVVIERRIIFKIELPNHRVIGVKSKPTKKIIEVLRPVTYKYKLMLDSLVVHLSESPVPLDLDITVASLDGQRILIETMEQYSAGTYKPQNGKNRLFKSASMDSIISGAKQENDTAKNDIKEANNNNTNRDRTKSASSQDSQNPRKHPSLVKSPSVDLNPPLAGIKKRGNLKVTGTETEDLIAQLSRANRRMDDQRGLTIKDLELPEFLKVPENKKPENNNGGTRANTSLGAPYVYEMPEFLKSYENKRTSQAAKDSTKERRPKSTPPSKEFSSHYSQGTIPTHEEAEALFGSVDGSIQHMHFNDSMMNLTGRESSGYDGRPNTRMSGISFQSSTSDGSLNRAEQFSPTPYHTTLEKVTELSGDNLEWDISDINGSMDKGNRTLTAPNADETFLPPPPTPDQIEHTLEEANYSPPPPMNHHRSDDDKRNRTSNSDRQNGSTIPGQNQNQNHNHNVPVSHLEDPMLRYNTDRSSGPPSPSTHDLVVSPGSGDQDPSFADGSQLSSSTSSTVTENSAHFGNSSYSGHSTYSSNSSQSRSSSTYNRPPAYPGTSDQQFRQVPPYSRSMSVPQGVSKPNPGLSKPNTARPRYPPPPIKPKPPRSSRHGASGGTSGEVHQRGKDRNEMTIIGKDGRKMRASFV